MLKKIIILAIVVGFAWACKTQLPGSSDSSKKPNIVFIMADDLGYGDVGFNGQTKIKTPALDQMAKEGVVLTNHYSGSPVCGPSRSCLLTGTHTGHTTVRGNPNWTTSGADVVLKEDDITVAEELKRAGYHTAILGKWGMDEYGVSGQANAQGFDYFYGYRRHGEAHHYYPKHLWRNTEKVPLEGNIPEETFGQYSHDLVANEALNYLDERAKSTEPFFMYVAFTTPHYELTVPEDSKTPYENLGWEKRPMKKGHYYNDEEGNIAYAGMVSRMDRDIGRIREKLKEHGMAENTLVIFTSDNGHEYDRGFFDSNGAFKGRKRDVYEGGIHVPFTAVWPNKIPEGSTSNHQSGFWDFLNTACEVAGIAPTKKDLDGISYLNALKGEKQKVHEYLYWEFNEGAGPRQALRKGDWKLVRQYKKDDELYNLSNDIGEDTDLSKINAKKLKELQALILTARTDDPNYELVKIVKKK
ncbi:arylsulfatase [Arcticibacterium luteifluviistationis]|uniref:Arylsulfatase n=1 Tax=Arcticibacterium luteifluviistationis TaxID=1784714 RepID=A0A2Z4GG38_9BACT|nr:arylsulfatase [Arcticibacterium luteifluviistationis]AWW00142.1 arylsulfatase [Arcticibacterium luteifluviistationis]